MGGESRKDLRVDPDSLLRLISTYEQASAKMVAILNEVQNRGRLEQPWTHDDVSVAMTDHYNEQIFGRDQTGQDPYCTLGALRMYREELVRVRDTLKQIHTDYLRAEAEAATGFNRL